MDTQVWRDAPPGSAGPKRKRFSTTQRIILLLLLALIGIAVAVYGYEQPSGSPAHASKPAAAIVASAPPCEQSDLYGLISATVERSGDVCDGNFAMATGFEPGVGYFLAMFVAAENTWALASIDDGGYAPSDAARLHMPPATFKKIMSGLGLQVRHDETLPDNSPYNVPGP